MAGKMGDKFFEEMKDRGRREIGGLFYNDSNIAQPTYPLHGERSRDAPDLTQGPSLEERLAQEPPTHDPPAREDRDRGIEPE